jgi:surface protein
VKLVTDMNTMFYGKSTFNSDISRWDVCSVTNMEQMFYGASSFNSNIISNWGISSVTSMYAMFNRASSFNQNLCPWGPKKPSNFDYYDYADSMFEDSGCLNINSPTGPTEPWCAVTTCP